jgi:hypothetical protein
MALKGGSSSDALYNGQGRVEGFLLLVAFICAPWMLFGKPALQWLRQRQRHARDAGRKKSATNNSLNALNGDRVSSSKHIADQDFSLGGNNSLSSIRMQQINSNCLPMPSSHNLSSSFASENDASFDLMIGSSNSGGGTHNNFSSVDDEEFSESDRLISSSSSFSSSSFSSTSSLSSSAARSTSAERRRRQREQQAAQSDRVFQIDTVVEEDEPVSPQNSSAGNASHSDHHV